MAHTECAQGLCQRGRSGPYRSPQLSPLTKGLHATGKSIRRQLRQLADPVGGKEMARYLRYRQPYLGVPWPPPVAALTICEARMFVSGDFAEAVAILRELWDGRWREARHADLRLAERWARFRHSEALPMYQ